MTQKTGGTPRYALLDHVPEMVTVSDRRGRILYANAATERVSGFAPEEFVSLDPFSRMHPEDRARCEEAFAELLGNPGLNLHLEHRVRHIDGSWRWVEGAFTSLFEDLEVGGLLATVRDVTERKRTKEALRESEEKYSAAFDSMDEGFCVMELVCDEDGEIVDLIFRETIKAFERNTGLSEVVGRTVGELLPAFESYWIETYSRVARTGEAVRTENYVRDVDRWYSVFFSLVGEVGSRHVAFLFDDITERKRAEGLDAAVGAILAGEATGSPAYGAGRADRPKSSLVGQGSPDILRRSGVGEKAVVGAGGDFLQLIAGKRHCKSPTRVHGTANRCDLLRSVNGQSPA